MRKRKWLILGFLTAGIAGLLALRLLIPYSFVSHADFDRLTFDMSLEEVQDLFGAPYEGPTVEKTPDGEPYVRLSWKAEDEGLFIVDFNRDRKAFFKQGYHYEKSFWDTVWARLGY